MRPHHDRLHDALGADRVGQFVERLGPHVEAWLIAAALQQIQRQVRQLYPAGRGGASPAAAARPAGVCPSRSASPRPSVGFFWVMAL